MFLDLSTHVSLLISTPSSLRSFSSPSLISFPVRSIYPPTQDTSSSVYGTIVITGIEISGVFRLNVTNQQPQNRYIVVLTQRNTKPSLVPFFDTHIVSIPRRRFPFYTLQFSSRFHLLCQLILFRSGILILVTLKGVLGQSLLL